MDGFQVNLWWELDIQKHRELDKKLQLEGQMMPIIVPYSAKFSGVSFSFDWRISRVGQGRGSPP